MINMYNIVSMDNTNQSEQREAKVVATFFRTSCCDYNAECIQYFTPESIITAMLNAQLIFLVF